MSLVSEFKEFISKGNVIDLAVGVVIGGAFGKIVDSLVNDVIMPPIGMAIGGVDFKGLKLILKEGAGDAAAVTVNYGNFIQNGITFLIIASTIFLFVVKPINAMRNRKATPVAPSAPPEPTKEEILLTEIRDALRNR